MLFEKKTGVEEGGLISLQFYQSLKRVELQISVRTSLFQSCKTIGLIWSPWKNKTNNDKTNKLASMVFLLVNNTKFNIFFFRKQLQIPAVGFFDMLNLSVWFSLRWLDFLDSESPLFQKSGKFSQTRSFRLVSLKLINFID